MHVVQPLLVFEAGISVTTLISQNLKLQSKKGAIWYTFRNMLLDHRIPCRMQ